MVARGLHVLLVADGSARDGKATPDGQIDGAQGHNINNDFDRMGSGFRNNRSKYRIVPPASAARPGGVYRLPRYLGIRYRTVSRFSCITYAMPGRGHMVVGGGTYDTRCAALRLGFIFHPCRRGSGESCEWRPASAQWAVPTRAEFTECRNSYPYYSALLSYTPMP